jgi:hypothetical protein
MCRRVLALLFVAVLGSTAALAQPVPLLLLSTPVSRTVFFSLDAVQVQVDATLRHAAASKVLIVVALAQPPLALLPSTPISRR